MTQEINQQQLEAQFKKLPLPVQTIISSLEWKKWVGEISKRHSLNLDQAAGLESEMFIFMLGLETRADFEYNLAREVGIDMKKLPIIMADINKDILGRLKNALIEETSKPPEQNLPPENIEEPKKEPPRSFSVPVSKPPLSTTIPVTSPIFTAMPQHIESTPENREALLRAIENPEPSKGFTPPVVPVTATNPTVLANVPVTQTSTPATVPAPASNILATKLGAVVSSPTKTETVKVVFTAPPKAPSIKTPASNDPYREPIE